MVPYNAPGLVNCIDLGICLFNYDGKPMFLMKYNGKSLVLYLVKSGYDNDMDSIFDDETNMLVLNGYFMVL